MSNETLKVGDRVRVNDGRRKGDDAVIDEVHGYSALITTTKQVAYPVAWLTRIDPQPETEKPSGEYLLRITKDRAYFLKKWGVAEERILALEEENASMKSQIEKRDAENLKARVLDKFADYCIERNRHIERQQALFTAAISREARGPRRGGEVMNKPRHVEVSYLRMLNSTSLRALEGAIIIDVDSKPVAALITYDAYLHIQDVMWEVRE